MSKEAMKLALEALKSISEMVDYEGNGFKLEYEIKALEEALAKQEHDGSLINEGTKSKQEQGKPVALETIYETIIHWDEGGGKRSRRELARRIVVLYTTPQQRKPLTDTQIDELAEWHALDHMVYEPFARAIEAAHGIKE